MKGKNKGPKCWAYDALEAVVKKHCPPEEGVTRPLAPDVEFGEYPMVASDPLAQARRAYGRKLRVKRSEIEVANQRLSAIANGLIPAAEANQRLSVIANGLIAAADAMDCAPSKVVDRVLGNFVAGGPIPKGAPVCFADSNWSGGVPALGETVVLGACDYPPRGTPLPAKPHRHVRFCAHCGARLWFWRARSIERWERGKRWCGRCAVVGDRVRFG